MALARPPATLAGVIGLINKFKSIDVVETFFETSFSVIKFIFLKGSVIDRMGHRKPVQHQAVSDNKITLWQPPEYL